MRSICSHPCRRYSCSSRGIGPRSVRQNNGPYRFLRSLRTQEMPDCSVGTARNRVLGDAERSRFETKRSTGLELRGSHPKNQERVQLSRLLLLSGPYCTRSLIDPLCASWAVIALPLLPPSSSSHHPHRFSPVPVAHIASTPCWIWNLARCAAPGPRQDDIPFPTD
jgi:hypothetical protein